MKKLLTFLFIISVIISCGESDLFGDDPNDNFSDVPPTRSYVTYISQNSVILNGFIDNSNNYYQGSDTYDVGFIFRAGDQNDSSNDQVILVDDNVEYYAGIKKFSTNIESLEPNTTYYYTSYTKNGNKEKDDWEEFTTSKNIPCSYEQNNNYSISGGARHTAYPQITDPTCCDEGNFGIKFGNWPNIYEINFNELSSDYPKTGQYFGVDYRFDISSIERELVRSTNQVLIGNKSTPETELFVVNNGETITLIFCDMLLRNGDTLNGKISISIP